MCVRNCDTLRKSNQTADGLLETTQRVESIYCFVHHMKVLLCLLALAAVQALQSKYSVNGIKEEGFAGMSPLRKQDYGSISMDEYDAIHNIDCGTFISECWDCKRVIHI